ncbi:MAG: metallophosphoesterase [Leeuwenhoekiella sp.]
MIEWNFFDLSEDAAKKLKIIHLSDLHIRGIKTAHKAITAKINAKKPDLIVFTGDSVEKSANLPLLNKFLNLLDHSVKKFAILGNWEHKGKVDLMRLEEIYKSNNCKLLINSNSTTLINDTRVSVIGLDDFNVGKADFKAASADFSPGDKVIALTHCPQHRDVIETQLGDLHIDLVLSGHTHGGQITMFGYAPIRPQGSGKYLNGMYDEKPRMYVSKGIGTSNLPLRLGPKAEVAEFHL